MKEYIFSYIIIYENIIFHILYIYERICFLWGSGRVENLASFLLKNKKILPQFMHIDFSLSNDFIFSSNDLTFSLYKDFLYLIP